MKRSIKQPASSSYQFLDKLGEGAFGYIWKVKHISSGQIFACKLVKNSMRKEKKLLQREIQILQILKSKKGFTQLFASGSDQQNTYFVMNLMGENLEQRRQKQGNFNRILPIGLEIIKLLKELHSLGVIHRDIVENTYQQYSPLFYHFKIIFISTLQSRKYRLSTVFEITHFCNIKPENFVMQDGKINLIDFGLSKKYIIDGHHIHYKENKGMIGTARYASINALKGIEQSRRDDLESLGYMLIYLHQGNLPWYSISDQDKEIRYLKIKKMKKALKIDKFFGLPIQLSSFMEYVKGLKFDEDPNYEYLISLFSQEESGTRLALQYFQPKPAIRLKFIQMQRTSFRSPPKEINSSRKASFEESSSAGSDIQEELQESIKLKNFIVGIKQPADSPIYVQQK